MPSLSAQLPSRTLPLTVIVADDLEEICQLAEVWLRERGCSVTCVGTGRDVLKAVRQHPVDVLVTDILMPDCDGLEVITELKRTHPHTRIVAISGGGVHLHAVDCLKLAKSLGAHAVLLKPFTRQQLLNAIEAALRTPASDG